MKTKAEVDYTLYDAVSALSYWFKFLLKRWYILLAFAVVGALLGVLYAWLKKPVYTAEIVYVAENESSGNLGGYAGLAAQFGLDLGMGSSGAFTGENLAAFLKSKASVERALLSPVQVSGKQTLLIDYYLHINNLDKALADKNLLSQVNYHVGMDKPNRVRDSMLLKVEDGIIKSDLSIDKIDKKLNYYSAKLKSNDEFFAKAFLESLTSNALTFYINYKSAKARQNVDVLQHQADSVRRMLYGNIEQVAAGTDVNVNAIRQIVKTGVQRRQIDAQVSGAVYTEIVKNLELSKIALRKETPFIQIIDTPKLPLEKKKPGRLMTGIIVGFLFGVLGILWLIVRQAFRNSKAKRIYRREREAVEV